MTVAKGGPPAPLPGPPWIAVLAPAIAQSLPEAVEIILTGMQTRANIRTAVQAVEAGHAIRMEACDYLEHVLQRYGRAMTPEVRDAYFIRLLELMDPASYGLPWTRLLPGR